MALVQGTLLDARKARKDLRVLQAQEENAFVVYLAPDGSFGATACGKDRGGEEPDSVLDAVFEHSDTDLDCPCHKRLRDVARQQRCEG